MLTADPSLRGAVVSAAVEKVAAAPNARSRLTTYLHQHPDALCSGASSSPKVVAALIASLVEAGSTVFVVPRCPDCDRAVELFHTRGPDERICAACWARARTAECVDCGRVRPIGQRLSDGTARCGSCRSRAHLEVCGGCGRLKQLARRLPDGTARCSTCVRRDTAWWETCIGCGRDRPVNARDADGKPLCASCYTQPLDSCDGCGELAVVASRLDGKVLCYRCYRHPQRVCGGCGRRRRVAVAARDDKPDLCATCHQAPMLVCGVCGTEDLCRTTTPDRSPICFRCQLARRLDEVLADPLGRLPAPLAPLREAILAVDRPRTALGWLSRSPAIPVLTAMAGGEQPLDHTTLDIAAGHRRGRAFAIEHLRQLLVASGALPDRDRNLARLETALVELVNQTHPDDQKILRTYATWRLLNKMRSQAQQGRPTQNTTYRARDLTAEAAHFLRWLRRNGRSLTECRQQELDAWLTRRPSARRNLPGFLRWAAQARLTGQLTLPALTYRDPTSFIADDERWAQARSTLADEQIPTQDRVAAALVLLYGQQAGRIARLTRADVDASTDTVLLRLGSDWIELPPPIGDLIVLLPQQCPIGMARHLADADQWLFPGRRPGQPASPATLSRRLRNLGIEPRAARNTALLQLGAELPSAVLADLLGLHINTAERWSAAAGARWTTYAAARSSPGR